MKVQSKNYKLFEEPVKHKTNFFIVFFMVLLTAFGLALFVSLKLIIVTTRPEVLPKYTRNFSKSSSGIEIPIKFASHTELVKNKAFIITLLFKCPLDLIANQRFLVDVFEDIGYELEDAYDSSFQMKKIVKAEVRGWKRKYEDVFEVFVKVDFAKGSVENFHEFIMPIFKATEHYVDDYYALVEEYRIYGMRRSEEVEEENADETMRVNEDDFVVVSEKIDDKITVLMN